jgi:hypothetical protein
MCALGGQSGWREDIWGEEGPGFDKIRGLKEAIVVVGSLISLVR